MNVNSRAKVTGKQIARLQILKALQTCYWQVVVPIKCDTNTNPTTQIWLVKLSDNKNVIKFTIR